jgi:hypothetical protein
MPVRDLVRFSFLANCTPYLASLLLMASSRMQVAFISLLVNVQGLQCPDDTPAPLVAAGAENNLRVAVLSVY